MTLHGPVARSWRRAVAGAAPSPRSAGVTRRQPSWQAGWPVRSGQAPGGPRREAEPRPGSPVNASSPAGTAARLDAGAAVGDSNRPTGAVLHLSAGASPPAGAASRAGATPVIWPTGSTPGVVAAASHIVAAVSHLDPPAPGCAAAGGGSATEPESTDSWAGWTGGGAAEATVAPPRPAARASAATASRVISRSERSTAPHSG